MILHADEVFEIEHNLTQLEWVLGFGVTISCEQAQECRLLLISRRTLLCAPVEDGKARESVVASNSGVVLVYTAKTLCLVRRVAADPLNVEATLLK